MIDWEAFKTQIQANPRKMLASILGIAVFFLVIWMFVAVQVDPSGENVAAEQSGRLDSLRLSLSDQFSDSLELKSNQNAAASKPEKANTSFMKTLPVFLVLILVIGGLWYWIKKGGAGTTHSNISEKNVFNLLGSQKIMAGKRITVIKINNEFWVLSTGGEAMQLLHRYTEDEWEGPDLPIQEEKESASQLFAKILRNEQVKEGPQ